MTNIEIIKSTYDANSLEEKRKKMAKYAIKDIRWTEAKGFPYGGTYIGLESVFEKVFDRLKKEWIGFKFKLEGYVSEGDKVVAFGTYSGVFKQTNKHFEARVAHIWKLQAGKIISFEQIVDSKSVSDSMKLT